MQQPKQPNQNTGQNSPSARPDEKQEKKDKKSPTDISFSTARQVYCTALQTALSDRSAARLAYERSITLYQKKKNLFEWTEKNYRIYRNLDLCLDNELTTGNLSLTANVTSYNTLSGTLYQTLTRITAAIKTLKTQVVALRDQASALENYKNDQCNATQWALLTGKDVENCKPAGPPPPVPRERPEVCKDADETYQELIVIVRKGLVFDVDSLLQSSADVTGIQTFSNVATLTALQTTLSTLSTSLVTQIQKTVTTRAADLTTAQANLVTAVQDCTKAGVDQYNKISVCNGAHFTLEFLCVPRCECVPIERPAEPAPRLRECECSICRIGDHIKSNYRGGL
ncbi:MAG TPA: hypothetical protein VG052_07415 [Puia sp.]|jgi:hypothetical protein|nr:hypothetical protein [Puia sp.]